MERASRRIEDDVVGAVTYIPPEINALKAAGGTRRRAIEKLKKEAANKQGASSKK